MPSTKPKPEETTNEVLDELLERKRDIEVALIKFQADSERAAEAADALKGELIAMGLSEEDINDINHWIGLEEKDITTLKKRALTKTKECEDILNGKSQGPL